MVFRRGVAAVVLLTFTGCMSIQTVGAPEQFIVKQSPDAIRATLNDGSILVIARPLVMDKRVQGIEAGTTDRVAVPLVDIQRIEARRLDKSRTLWLAIGIAAVAAAAVIFYTPGNPDFPSTQAGCPSRTPTGMECN